MFFFSPKNKLGVDLYYSYYKLLSKDNISMKVIFSQGTKTENGYSPNVSFVYDNGLVAYKPNYNNKNYYQEFDGEASKNKEKERKVRKIEFSDRSFSSWGVPQLEG
jgi:hypothetical protein